MAQALESSEDGRLISSAEFPYGVIYANRAWTKLTEYNQHEIEGKDLGYLRGDLTDPLLIEQMMSNVKSSGFGNACVINYTKSGKPFWCEISVQPIVSKDMYGDNQVTHFVATVTRNTELAIEKDSFGKISESVLASRKRESNSGSDSEGGTSSSGNSISDTGSASPSPDSNDDNSGSTSDSKSEEEAPQTTQKTIKRSRFESNYSLANDLLAMKRLCH
eukprot:CAMPEP_0119040592 /NCGR_PEP_ID=MMETSP1177-20130426/10590_1 /TAXON_ID=2985 /ORGANISM="Ochromonas sp, Strain CCMP1899" /LENGTH=218 /DNA_ID=CAMNT_0007005825 /DNA_START=150 /DNA_END=806 /DNA_ORIENTATION=-